MGESWKHMDETEHNEGHASTICEAPVIATTNRSVATTSGPASARSSSGRSPQRWVETKVNKVRFECGAGLDTIGMHGIVKE